MYISHLALKTKKNLCKGLTNFDKFRTAMPSWTRSAIKISRFRKSKMAAAVIFNKRLCYGRGTARHACQKKFCNYITSHLKTRVPGLSCRIICVILCLAVFVQYRSVTDTHRQTDGQTDTQRRHVPCLA